VAPSSETRRKGFWRFFSVHCCYIYITLIAPLRVCGRSWFPPFGQAQGRLFRTGRERWGTHFVSCGREIKVPPCLPKKRRDKDGAPARVGNVKGQGRRLRRPWFPPFGKLRAGSFAEDAKRLGTHFVSCGC
jgi:hypothetical protein